MNNGLLCPKLLRCSATTTPEESELHASKKALSAEGQSLLNGDACPAPKSGEKDYK